MTLDGGTFRFIKGFSATLTQTSLTITGPMAGRWTTMAGIPTVRGNRLLGRASCSDQGIAQYHRLR